jgi:hypothetical protein
MKKQNLTWLVARILAKRFLKFDFKPLTWLVSCLIYRVLWIKDRRLHQVDGDKVGDAGVTNIGDTAPPQN